MLVLFLLAILLRIVGKQHAFRQYTPTLLTSIGILGTFCGIVAGLLGFDVNSIDTSIDMLLAGMKTAFTTSLVGMGLSILYKLSSSLFPAVKNEGDVSDEDIGIADMYKVMQSQRDGIEKINDAIGGSNESSLTGQLKLLRADSNDNQKRIVRNIKRGRLEFQDFQKSLETQLAEFSEMMSKSATEQIIEALKEVISDFNNNLTEQFGENFKQLNLAVNELVTWQDNYKNQLKDMSEQYSLGVTAITKTEASVAQINEHSQQIPNSMQALKNVLEVNQHQINELDKHLVAFKDVRDRAVEAVPELDKRIESTLTGVANASQKLIDGIADSGGKLQTAIVTGADEFVTRSDKVNASLQATSDVIVSNNEKNTQVLKDGVSDLTSNLQKLSNNLIDDSKKVSQQLKESTKDIVDETSRSKAQFDEGLRTMRGELSQSLQEMASKQVEESQRVFSALRSQIEDSVSTTGEAVEKQVSMIDKALEAEIERTMNDMGRALASISGKFTEDYQSLVREMRLVAAG